MWNVAVHPTSQSWATEIKDVPFKAGKRWTVRAMRGRQGKGSSAVCVDRMVLLSAKCTVRGLFVRRLFLRWVDWTWKKWPVEPLSISGLVGREAGPSCEAFNIFSLFVLSDSSALGSPPFQDRLLSRRTRRVASNGLHPVIRLSKVASSWWPSWRLLQVRLLCSGVSGFTSDNP